MPEYWQGSAIEKSSKEEIYDTSPNEHLYTVIILEGRKQVTGLNKIHIKEFDSVIDLLEELDREGITGEARAGIYKRYLNTIARQHGVPLCGSFELTPLCNFDCKMCYVHLNKEQMQGRPLLTTDQWIDIMDHAIDAGMMYADLTGGECLSYPGFREIYLHLRSRGIGVVILTNGQLLTEELADLFAQYPPDSLQMTVYGSNEDAYEAVTGRRAFEDVKRAIQLLKDRNIRTFLSITPSRYIQKDIGELLTFLHSTGLRFGVGISSISARDDTGRNLSDYAPEADFYVRFHREQMQFIDPLSQPQKKTSPAWVAIPKGFSPQTMLACSSGQSTFHMNWKGEMYPCIPFHSVNRSVLEHGFENCWAWIKEQMKTYVPPSECMTCTNRSVCDVCSAERTMGILNGPLNKMACEKCELLVKNGIKTLPAEQECL